MQIVELVEFIRCSGFGIEEHIGRVKMCIRDSVNGIPVGFESQRDERRGVDLSGCLLYTSRCV